MCQASKGLCQKESQACQLARNFCHEVEKACQKGNSAAQRFVKLLCHNGGVNNTKNAAGNTARTTIAPVAASPTNDAEFVDAPGLQSRFGIKRSLAYTLMAEGAIRGVSLRRHGQLKGKRLFDVASVRAYLHSQMETRN